MGMRLSSEWMDHTRLEVLRKRPRFSPSGKEVTNPYTYCALDALERLAWHTSDLQLAVGSHLVVRLWIKEENLSFRAVAVLEVESNRASKAPGGVEGLEARKGGDYELASPELDRLGSILGDGRDSV